MTEGEQDKGEDSFIQKLLLDESLDPNTKSRNRMLTENFHQNNVLKALSTLDTGELMDDLQSKIVRQIVCYIAEYDIQCHSIKLSYL